MHTLCGLFINIQAYKDCSTSKRGLWKRLSPILRTLVLNIPRTARISHNAVFYFPQKTAIREDFLYANQTSCSGLPNRSLGHSYYFPSIFLPGHSGLDVENNAEFINLKIRVTGEPLPSL